MNTKRRKELKHAVLSHIAKTIVGETQDWNALKEWLDFEFADETEEDVAAYMFHIEANRLFRRIN